MASIWFAMRQNQWATVWQKSLALADVSAPQSSLNRGLDHTGTDFEGHSLSATNNHNKPTQQIKRYWTQQKDKQASNTAELSGPDTMTPAFTQDMTTPKVTGCVGKTRPPLSINEPDRTPPC